MTLEEHLKSIAKPQDINTIEQTWQTGSFRPFAWAAFDNSKTLAGHVRLDDPYFDGKLNYAFDEVRQVWYQIDGIDFDSDYTITVDGHYYNIYYHNPDSGQFDYVRTEFVDLNDDNVLSLEFGAGDNRLITGEGHIKADLGAGNDTFLRAPRDNGLWSAEADLGEGDDTADLQGQGADAVKGGGGHDIIQTHGGDDTIHGEDGNDVLNLGTGDDIAFGGKDQDVIYVRQSGTKQIDGGEDLDTIVLSTLEVNQREAALGFGGVVVDLEKATTINGIEFTGSASGKHAVDFKAGLNSIEQVIGTKLNDDIFGTAEADYFGGNSGDDLLNGRGGDDILALHDGNDTGYGGDGDDTIITGDGHDFAFGENDNDKIYVGEFGIKELDGGDGIDTVLFSYIYDFSEESDRSRSIAIDQGRPRSCRQYLRQRVYRFLCQLQK